MLLRLEFCHSPGDKAAPRMADQAGTLDPDGIQEGHHVGGEVLNAVTAGRPLGVAVAALVHGEGVVARGQQRQDPAVGEPGVGVSGQEHDRLSARITLFGIVHPRAASKACGRKPKLLTILLHGCLSASCTIPRRTDATADHAFGNY
jgi:hypothetical protein